MSLLETLPIELLEKIFVFCVEFNLPRASPALMVKLSSDQVYAKVVIAAFGPYWDRRHNWENSKKDVGSRLSDSDEDVDSNEDVDSEEDFASNEDAVSGALQSAILRCRWATQERMRSAEQTWLRQKERKIGTWTPLPDSVPNRSTFQNLVPERYDSLSHDFFDEDYSSFIEKTPSTQWLKWSPIAGMEKLSGAPLLTLPPPVGIPLSLLEGPWDEEKLKNLFYLYRAEADIAAWNIYAKEEGKGNSQEVKDSLKSAILGGNIHVVYLLTQFHIWIPITPALIMDFLSINSETLSLAIMNCFLRYFRRSIIREFHHMSARPCVRTVALTIYGRPYCIDPEREKKWKEAVMAALRKMRRGRNGRNVKLKQWADVIEGVHAFLDHTRNWQLEGPEGWELNDFSDDDQHMEIQFANTVWRSYF